MRRFASSSVSAYSLKAGRFCRRQDQSHPHDTGAVTSSLRHQGDRLSRVGLEDGTAVPNLRSNERKKTGAAGVNALTKGVINRCKA